MPELRETTGGRAFGRGQAVFEDVCFHAVDIGGTQDSDLESIVQLRVDGRPLYVWRAALETEIR